MPGPGETIAERVALNQSTFRSANERIEAAADHLRGSDDPMPFICECAHPRCSEIVALTIAEYEAVRESPTRFFAVPGHESQEVDGLEVAKVLERRDRYSVLEKVGRAAEVAAELDPRG